MTYKKVRICINSFDKLTKVFNRISYLEMTSVTFAEQAFVDFPLFNPCHARYKIYRPVSRSSSLKMEMHGTYKVNDLRRVCLRINRWSHRASGAIWGFQESFPEKVRSSEP